MILRLLGLVQNNGIVTITSLYLKWSENGTLAQYLKIEKIEKGDQGIHSTCKDY